MLSLKFSVAEILMKSMYLGVLKSLNFCKLTGIFISVVLCKCGHFILLQNRSGNCVGYNFVLFMVLCIIIHFDFRHNDAKQSLRDLSNLQSEFNVLICNF